MKLRDYRLLAFRLY